MKSNILLALISLFCVFESYANESIGRCNELIEPVERVAPSYPESPINRAQEGKVVLVVQVKVDGSVSSVRIIESTNEYFNEISIHAVKQWKYPPQKISCLLEQVLIF